jgi:tRNA threonylcarbamoyladenosine biosynthesis protein TsaB
MIVLGLDSSTRATSVALINKTGLLGEYFLNTGVPHSQSLLAIIDELLQRTGVGLDDIAGIAVSAGPGAFTGLRVGVSTAKGLGLAKKKPLIPVPTLDALAQAVAYSRHLVCPVLNAKKKQVYAALYSWEESGFGKLTPDLVITPAELAAKITQPVVFLGDALDEYAEEIRRMLGEHARFAPLDLWLPRASRVAELGLKELEAGRTVSAHELAPLYVRRPEAEVNWEARLNQQQKGAKL